LHGTREDLFATAVEYFANLDKTNNFILLLVVFLVFVGCIPQNQCGGLFDCSCTPSAYPCPLYILRGFLHFRRSFLSFFDTRYARFASLFVRAITGFSPKVMILRKTESPRTRTKLAHRDPQATSATSTVAAKSLLGPRHVCATGTYEDWLESHLLLADGPPSNHSRLC